MNSGKLIFFLCCATGLAASAQALSAQSSSTNNAPISDSASSQGTTHTPAGSQTQTPSKKVWTNDVLNNLQNGSAISTFDSSSSGKPNKAQNKPAASNGKGAKWYQDQITKLNAQIPALESQIAELQAAIDGKATGDGQKSTRPYSVRFNDWQTELDRAKKKRADILAKIDALRDEARHNGISPNVLP